MGSILGYVGSNIVEAERKAIQKTRGRARAAMMEIFNKAGKRARKDRVPKISLQTSKGKEDISSKIFNRFFAIRTRDDGSKSFLRRTLDALAGSYIFVPFVSLALYIGKQEGWTSITSLYFAMATSSTVGYGDVAPTSSRMRLLSMVFIPLAVISLGELLSQIAGYFIRREVRIAEQEFMDRTMTLADLEAMDTNQDGKI